MIYTYGANMGGLNLKNKYSDQSSIALRGIDSSKYYELISGCSWEHLTKMKIHLFNKIIEHIYY